MDKNIVVFDAGYVKSVAYGYGYAALCFHSMAFQILLEDANSRLQVCTALVVVLTKTVMAVLAIVCFCCSAVVSLAVEC